MPTERPSRKERDQFEGFARSALGKPRQDPPKKKAAPVDTVRLKKDYDRDVDDIMRTSRVNGPDSTKRYTENNKFSGVDMKTKTFNRAIARRDTLDAARKGKPLR